MADAFDELAESIRTALPDSQLELATESQLTAIRQEYPEAPPHYLEFLLRVGWGSIGNGNFMIYNGLCRPEEFFDETTSGELSGIVFFGDDFGGWMAGFDTRDDWRLIGVDSTSPIPYPENAQTVAAFIAQRIAGMDV